MRKEEFWDFVEIGEDKGCWPWKQSLTHNGYGKAWLQVNEKLVSVRAARIAYELTYGPIPEGLVPDHLCRHRDCCNPSHLELVTHKVNVLRGIGPTAINARKTHCSQGHALVDLNGVRGCPLCKKELRLRTERITAAHSRMELRRARAKQIIELRGAGCSWKAIRTATGATEATIEHVVMGHCFKELRRPWK